MNGRWSPVNEEKKDIVVQVTLPRVDAPKTAAPPQPMSLSSIFLGPDPSLTPEQQAQRDKEIQEANEGDAASREQKAQDDAADARAREVQRRQAGAASMHPQ